MSQQQEPTFTVSQSALNAFANALQQQLNRSQALHVALNLVNVSDQQLAGAWRDLERALVKVERPRRSRTKREPAAS